MNNNLKTILKYIQLYTDCDNYAMSKISLLFDLYPIERIKIETIEKEVKDFIRGSESIDDWAENYLIENQLTFDLLTENNRKFNTVKRRYLFAKAARERGFILTEIGRKLKMHHSSIIHLLNHYQPI
ncbi:hypothetical protein UFOVP1384_26 [uncultured Caudovirales phage]|uniref:Uncharacterized protein n=1 Tax=uncultured Caudovirales phage TaxID=2100421 RepID=A0A6J5S6H9_9CAUD|nr:hypothetical protein UFOVP1384_26 [uncultured Caudovirales phage]